MGYFLWHFELNTVQPVYNDHPQDPKFVAVVDRWSMFGDRYSHMVIET